MPPNASTKKKTISLPADLAAEMAAIRGVNWSALAAAAFRKEIKKMQNQTDSEQLIDSVKLERLREQRREHTADLHSAGVKQGAAWAQEQNYAALEAFVELVQNTTRVREGIQYGSRPEWLDVLWQYAEDERFDFEPDDFFEVNPRLKHEAFAEGFCEGAETVFDAI